MITDPDCPACQQAAPHYLLEVKTFRDAPLVSKRRLQCMTCRTIFTTRAPVTPRT